MTLALCLSGIAKRFGATTGAAIQLMPAPAIHREKQRPW